MNQNMQHAEPLGVVHCPTCSATHLYHLADGRLKCAVCRRVFSACDNRHSKLPIEVREALAHAYWKMEGTTDTALSLQLNIKTVQKYFSLLRENLSRLSQQQVIEQTGTDQLPTGWLSQFPQRPACGVQAQPIAAIIRTEAGMNLLQAAPVATHPRFSEESVLGWIYAQDADSKQRLNLDKIHCQARDSNSITLTAPFWRFVKHGLIHYQGGFRHNFFQYLREMEFRYNDRQTQCGPDICLHHLAVE